MIDTHFVRLRLFEGASSGIGPEVGRLPTPISVDVSLDVDRSPYVQASFTIPRPSRAWLSKMDPRTYPIVEIFLQRSTAATVSIPATLADVSDVLAGGTLAATTTALNATTLSDVSAEFPPEQVTTRWTPGSEQDETFKSRFLYITSLSESYRDDTLTVTLASGEFRLDDHKRVSPDILEVSYLGPDARTVIGALIERVGGYLTWAGGLWPWTGETAYWHPGQSLSELIDPVLEQGGVRIYAESATQYTIAPIGAHSGTGAIISQIDLTNTPDLFRADRELSTSSSGVGWYDAALVIYQWNNAAGEKQVAYDRYPTSGANKRSRIVTRNAAYPGPGAAQGIVGRSEQRGYSIDVTTSSDYFLNPGWTARLKLPDETTASVWAIQTAAFNYPDGEMTLTLQATGT